MAGSGIDQGHGQPGLGRSPGAGQPDDAGADEATSNWVDADTMLILRAVGVGGSTPGRRPPGQGRRYRSPGPIYTGNPGKPCRVDGPQGQRRPGRKIHHPPTERPSLVHRWRDPMTTRTGLSADPASGGTTTPVALDRAPTTGLYVPGFEHDACGIALVADLHGRRSHGLVRQGIVALEHLAHRGRPGARRTAATGPASSSRFPTSSSPRWPASSCPALVDTRWASPFCPRTGPRRRRPSWPWERLADEEGLSPAGLARRALRPHHPGAQWPGAVMPPHAPGLRGPGTGHHPGRRRPGQWPSTDWPSSCASGPSTRSSRSYLASLSARTIDLQGDADHPPTGRVLPRSLRRTPG